MKSIPLVRVTFLMMAAVLFVSLAIAYLVGLKTIERSAEISARENSLRQVQEVFSTLQDMETGQRGFLLAGRPEYLEPYYTTLDLVLSDIGLPDGTGIELLAKAREFCNTPMIALTGYGMEDDLAKYREAGFLHQLTKPIRFEQLETLLVDFASAHGRPAGLRGHTPSPEWS